MASERRQLLRVADLIDIAIAMEQAGERFYLRAAKLTDDPRTKKTFEFLANEESHHKELFEMKFEREKKLELHKELPKGYFEYLNVLGSTLLFSDDELEKLMDGVTTCKQAIEFAIAREKDSMLFYYELAQFIPLSEQETIDAIIAEERKHFEILTNMKSVFI